MLNNFWKEKFIILSEHWINYLTTNSVDNNRFHITESCYMNFDVDKRVTLILFKISASGTGSLPRVGYGKNQLLNLMVSDYKVQNFSNAFLYSNIASLFLYNNFGTH